MASGLNKPLYASALAMGPPAAWPRWDILLCKAEGGRCSCPARGEGERTKQREPLPLRFSWAPAIRLLAVSTSVWCPLPPPTQPVFLGELAGRREGKAERQGRTLHCFGLAGSALVLRAWVGGLASLAIGMKNPK